LLGNVDSGYYYEVIDMEMAMESQTVLANEMDGELPPVAHGVLLHLRLKSPLGYKRAK
jgi:DMSO/TMAO reductase YedYZ molybdopterin-dependent catalytic subunit